MIKEFFIYLLIFSFASCRVLNKVETAAVQSLVKALDTSTVLPGRFATEYYQITISTKRAIFALEKKSAQKIIDLDAMIAAQNQADSIINGYNSGFSILKKYGDLILSLTDTSYLKAFSKQKDAFIPSFDTLIVKYNSTFSQNQIPLSLGGIVTKMVSEIGTRRINYLQRKYLKELVTTYNPIISSICDEYKIIDFYKNSKGLNFLNEDISDVYKNILDFSPEVDLNDFDKMYTIYDPIYLNWKNRATLLTQFNDQTLQAMSKLKRAHNQLSKELNKNIAINDFTKVSKIFTAQITG